VPESLSETSTVQVVLPLTATEAGEQPVTELVVERVVTLSAKPVASELAAWREPLGL